MSCGLRLWAVVLPVRLHSVKSQGRKWGSGGVTVAHDSLTHHSARAPQTHKCQPPNMNGAHGALI